MSVARFLIGRAGVLGATLLVASFLVFTALFLAYPDPIPFLTRGHAVSPQAEAALRAQYHLDDPFLERYAHWLAAALQGNFGQSAITREPVAAVIADRAGITLLLVGYSTLLIVLIGLSAGIIAGTADGVLGAGARLLTRAGLAMPTFVLGPALIAFFAVSLGWFPVFGSGSGLVEHLWHLTLPAIALSVMLAAYVGRVTTAAVWDEYDREHVETARARGLPERTILRRHVVRNALIPVTTATAVTMASLISGAVVVETIFGIDGLGSLLLRSVIDGDFPTVQGVVLVCIAALVVTNLALDLLNAALDPRIGAAG